MFYCTQALFAITCKNNNTKQEKCSVSTKLSKISLENVK